MKLGLIIFWLSLQSANAFALGNAFPQPNQDFAQYQQDALHYLSDRAMRHRDASAIALNAPFSLSADSRVVNQGKFLLIHGLNDSPYVWREFADRLAQLGYDVRAILLPGHGTTPADMIEVSYKDWLLTARQHFDLWDVDDTPIYIGGFSLGGVIATIIALETGKVDGLFLVSPAYSSRLKHLLRWSWLYGKFQPWLFGGMILEDNPIKYNSIAINSGTQFYNSTKYLERLWNDTKLEVPVLAVVTEDDSVVEIDEVRKIISTRFNSDRKKLILYSGQKNAKLDAHEELRNSAYLERRLLNQSHLSLINSPQNYLYGKDRKVLVCNGNEYPIFMACMGASGHWYGAQHTPSPDGVPVARTTYNPDFEYVVEQLVQTLSGAD